MSAPFASARDYALAYAGLGFHVLPLHSVGKQGDRVVCGCNKKEACPSPAKHPIWQHAPHGLKDATIDQTILRKWFSGFGKHNVGITTGSVSGIVVLDIDAKSGGYESLAEIEAKHGALPPTLRFRTGGGGMHYVFQHPGEEIRNSAGILGSGVDVRGDGGYIVAPPSRHVSSGLYQLADGCSLDTPLAALPAWLLRLMRQGGGHNRDAMRPNVADLVRGQIPEGQRNSTIARISGHLLAKRVDTSICLDLMLAFNEARCNPPLDAQEVARVVVSIDHRAFT